MYCGKCGSKIPEGYEFCMNCGSKIESPFVVIAKDSDCKEFRYPKRSIGKKQKVILLITLVCILLMVSVVATVFYFHKPEDDMGYFANIPWGTDIKTAEKMVEEKLEIEGDIKKEKDSEGNDTLHFEIKNYEGASGIDTNARLFFDSENCLNQVTVFVLQDGSDKGAVKETADRLIAKFDSLYGKHYKKLEYEYNWMAEDAAISISQLTDDLLIMNFEKR